MSAVKIKFVGLLRGLLRRIDNGGTETTGEIEHSHPVSAAMPVSPVAPPSVVSQPQPIIEPVVPLVQTNPDEIQLPLAPILAGLPIELRGKIVTANTASMVISLPVDTILPQLATGLVKISFGELRRLALGVFANSGGEHDSKPVALPLHQVLAQLNPILLARRAAQKQIEVSDDISSPFDANGHGLKISTEKMKAPAPAPMPAPAPEPVPMSRFNTPAPAAPVSRTPVGAPPPAFTPRWNTSAAAPAANGGSNGNGNGNGHSHGPAKPAGFDVPMDPLTSRAKTPAPVPAPKPAPVQIEKPILVSLISLAESWPEALRQEIDLLDLRNAQVALSPSLIEPALKRGRVVFTWRDLRSWIQNVAVAVSTHDNLELELPLSLLAPLFFARHKNNGAGAKKIAVAEEIPNLFFGFPQPTVEPPVATPPIPMPAVAPIPMPSAVAAAVPAPSTDTNYFARASQPETSDSEFKRKGGTDFSSRAAVPADIISRAMKLPGVVGSVIALPDGLKVASQIPAELNGDTLAAFLPQIFARVNQCSRELRMGELNNLNFTVGNVPWKIFRVNAVYFAAFGRANEPLPGAPLAALAAELDLKKA
jgi:predicted regulator of Ras-like GTPase activity (Roadblock/LC7/MglB family)